LLRAITLSRNRFWIITGLIAVIGLGLASRKYPLFPAFLGKYPGDAFWAMMVYFGIAFIKPSARVKIVGIVSLAIACLDEFSQMYQVQWLNSIRDTTIGHLILGSMFSWNDIMSYLVGIAIAICIDLVVVNIMCKQ
jgi:hypothetical protein